MLVKKEKNGLNYIQGNVSLFSQAITEPVLSLPKFSKIKIQRQNRNSFHAVSLNIVIILLIYIFFQIFIVF